MRAFPTAHLSPHVSAYLLIMRYTTWGAWYWRSLGGLSAFGVAYVLFWCAYETRTRVHSREKERIVGFQVLSRHNPADVQESVHDRRPAISFNNAYRHVYAE